MRVTPTTIKQISEKSTKQALAGVIVLCFVISIISACAGEIPETAYSDMETAIADDAVERGWIPEWLPPSAYNIQE